MGGGGGGGFRVSPLLAIRDLAGGWEGMAPALLVLVAAAAVLRLGGILSRPAVGGALLLLLALGVAGITSAAAAVPLRSSSLEAPPPILLIGDPREGPVADLAAALRVAGLRTASSDLLPVPLPPETEVVLLGRAPRGEEEAGRWRETLRSFLRAGGRAAAAPGPAGDLLLAAAEPGVLGLAQVVPDRGSVDLAALLLARPRTLLPHPAAGPEPGVAPEFFRVPFPTEPRALPGRVLGFLGVLAAGFAAVALSARRRGYGQVRTGGALALLAAVGSALLLLPGLSPGETAEARLVLEERASPGAATARRLEFVRVERTAAGEGTAAVDLDAAVRWTELLYEAGAEGTFDGAGAVRLAGPGRWALLAGVSGSDTPPAPGPFLAALRVREGRAWTVPGGSVGAAPGEGPGEPLESALAGWRRSEDPRVARAGRLLSAALRPRGESFTLAVPAAGADGVVFRED